MDNSVRDQRGMTSDFLFQLGFRHSFAFEEDGTSVAILISFLYFATNDFPFLIRSIFGYVPFLELANVLLLASRRQSAAKVRPVS